MPASSPLEPLEPVHAGHLEKGSLQVGALNPMASVLIEAEGDVRPSEEKVM